MSANGRGRAEFESASHPDGHGTNLGQAGDRSRNQPGDRTIVASDPSTALADKRQAFRPEQDAIKALTAIVFALRVPLTDMVVADAALSPSDWRRVSDNPMPMF